MTIKVKSEITDAVELFRARLDEARGISARFESLKQAGEYIADTTICACIENIVVAGSGFDHEVIKREMPHKGIAILDAADVNNPDIEFAGVAGAEFAIAETGSIILDAAVPEVRAASALSKIHFAIVSIDDIFENLDSAQTRFNQMLKKGSGFISMITGPSRTADIERILAIGVHGPLELHVLIVNKIV
jgi:L-lactate dehydrogenase complex protein LldG